MFHYILPDIATLGSVSVNAFYLVKDPTGRSLLLCYNSFMQVVEANRIIKDYGKCLARGTIGETILRKSSWLPYSKGKIKYAYFVLIESIIGESGVLAADERKRFTEDYSILNTFIDDDLADKYASNYRQWQEKKPDTVKSKKDEMLIKQYIGFTHLLRSGNFFDEINDYIEELLGKK